MCTSDEDSGSSEEEMKRRAKHVLRCKKAIWKRWTGEYIRALRERHNLKNEGKQNVPNVGQVVLIRNDSKNCGKWNIGVITKLYKGRDGVVRGAQLNLRKTTIDHPIQDLYPMELSTEQRKKAEQVLNSEAKVFRPRGRGHLRHSPLIVENKGGESVGKHLH